MFTRTSANSILWSALLTDSAFLSITMALREEKPLYHPILVFAIPAILTLRFGWSMVTPVNYGSRHFHLMIGDFGYFMGLKSHLNATAFLVFLVAVLSHAINIIDYFRGKPEQCLAVFDMMSGRVSPASIGLYNCKTIEKIVTKSRRALRFNDITRFCITFLAFFCCFFAFVFALSWVNMLLFGKIDMKIFTCSC